MSELDKGLLNAWFDEELNRKNKELTEKDKELKEKDESISYALRSLSPSKSISELATMFKISEEKVKEYLDRPVTDNTDSTNLFN